MPSRLVDRFAVGTPVEVLFRTPAGEAWVPGSVVRHAHPGVWVQAPDRSRWFVTNGSRIRERGAPAPAGGAAPPGDRTVYKIAGRDEWAATERTGVYPGSPADLRDDFVHLSTGEQVRETAAKHFATRDDLVLLDVAVARIDPSALRWEPSRGGALFPHVHGPLRRDAVVRVRDLPLRADGRHEFPADVG
jgi:uncharacterized protein (DUF952 family)